MTDPIPADVPETTNTTLPNDVVDTPSTVNGVPVDEAPSADITNGGNLNPDVTDIQPGVPTPADVTNEVNQGDILETQELELFVVTDETDGARTLEIQRPTTYFEVADKAEATISAFELANRNGVHNSVYDLNIGDKVTIPAPQLPIVTEPPAVDLETATQQNIATQNAVGSIAAQAVDAQAMINPQFAADAAGVAPISIPGGLAPSTAATPGVVGEVIEAPAGDTIETGVAPDGNAEATIVAPALVDGTPDTITTPDHPTPAVVEPEPDIITTPDHPTPAKVDVLPDVTVPPVEPAIPGNDAQTDPSLIAVPTTTGPIDLSSLPAPVSSADQVAAAADDSAGA